MQPAAPSPAHRSSTAATPMPPSSRIQIWAITSPSLMRPAGHGPVGTKRFSGVARSTVNGENCRSRITVPSAIPAVGERTGEPRAALAWRVKHADACQGRLVRAPSHTQRAVNWSTEERSPRHKQAQRGRHSAHGAARTRRDGAVRLVDGINLAVVPVVDGLQHGALTCTLGRSAAPPRSKHPPTQAYTTMQQHLPAMRNSQAGGPSQHNEQSAVRQVCKALP